MGTTGNGSGFIHVVPESEYITICVYDLDGSCVMFKMKKTMQFRRLMLWYTNRAGVSMSSLCFEHNGQRIGKTDTPLTLGVQDGDSFVVNLLRHCVWTGDAMEFTMHRGD